MVTNNDNYGQNKPNEYIYRCPVRLDEDGECVWLPSGYEIKGVETEYNKFFIYADVNAKNLAIRVPLKIVPSTLNNWMKKKETRDMQYIGETNKDKDGNTFEVYKKNVKKIYTGK